MEGFWCKIEKKGFCSDIWEIVEFRSSKSFYFSKYLKIDCQEKYPFLKKKKKYWIIAS